MKKIKNKKNYANAKKSSKVKTKIKKNKKTILINKKMSFGEILNRYPQAAGILMARGMHCMGCGMAMYETLEQGALMHGFNPDELVKEINKNMEKK